MKAIRMTHGYELLFDCNFQVGSDQNPGYFAVYQGLYYIYYPVM